jgi:hypothetical protein
VSRSPFQPAIGANVHACVSLVPVRSEPADASEQVTQLLFGESASVLENGLRDWVRVRCLHDGYEGWCDAKMLQSSPDFKGGHLLKSVTSTWRWPDGSVRQLPAGGWVEMRGDQFFSPDGHPIACVAASGEGWEHWLGAPYLWGGRSVAGVDCSGLMQVLARLDRPDVFVDRDASDQMKLGETIAFEERAAGDWAFFANDAGRIVHVGGLIDANTILHAAGEVRLDALTERGIERKLPSGEWYLTHRLAGIRRHP